MANTLVSVPSNYKSKLSEGTNKKEYTKMIDNTRKDNPIPQLEENQSMV